MGSLGHRARRECMESRWAINFTQGNASNVRRESPAHPDQPVKLAFPDRKARSDPKERLCWRKDNPVRQDRPEMLAKADRMVGPCISNKINLF